MRLYHFTSPLHLPIILSTGRLKVTESNVSYRIEHAGPDVVWLLDTPDPGAGRDHGLRKRHPSHPDKREIRFTVDVPDYLCHRWTDWLPAKGMPAVEREAMIETGGGADCASHWWVTERIIREDRWVSIERRTESGWVLIWSRQRERELLAAAKEAQA